MTATLPRPVRQELASLRSSWRLWKRGGPHPAYSTICPDRCGLPECEGCAATAYRRDRIAEIEDQAAALGKATR
jgi:hypothetical protein